MLAHDLSGRTSFKSLLAATHFRRGWDARNAAAKMLVEAYPDSLESWNALAFTNDVTHGSQDTTAITAYKSAFERFDAAARQQQRIPPQTLGTLAWMAPFASDSSHRVYWENRLLAESPRSRQGARVRAVRAIEQYYPDPRALARALPDLERIWLDMGSVDPSHLTFGLQSAIAAKDSEAVERWGKRYIAMNAGSAEAVSWVGRELCEFSSTRADGLRLLRSLLVPIDVVNDPDRPLFTTARARQLELGDLHARTLQYIGEALLADGKPVAALDSLRRAVQSGWSVVRFDAVARAALRAGDVATATTMFALISIDPATSPQFTDSARSALGARVSDSVWTASVIAARKEMPERVLSGSVRTPVHGDRIELLNSAGENTTFAKLAAGHVSVVAFGMDLRYPKSPVDRNEMQQLARDLAAQNARLITISLHPYAADLPTRIRALAPAYEIAFDEHRTANRAFEAYGFPIYYVVDDAGTIRFAYSSVRDLRLQVLALRQEARAAVTR